jgi:hypothetical protein
MCFFFNYYHNHLYVVLSDEVRLTLSKNLDENLD